MTSNVLISNDVYTFGHEYAKIMTQLAVFKQRKFNHAFSWYTFPLSLYVTLIDQVLFWYKAGFFTEFFHRILTMCFEYKFRVLGTMPNYVSGFSWFHKSLFICVWMSILSVCLIDPREHGFLPAPVSLPNLLSPIDDIYSYLRMIHVLRHVCKPVTKLSIGFCWCMLRFSYHCFHMISWLAHWKDLSCNF